ncbi:MAG TPA: flagellar hook-associated protein FlgK [Bryobacteraceae bacterium]|jgi:flagellar hook-associated protein 1 FlgK|nr:flagellar hook-associated protein FlgK [Bryobacteraceae bacterium]
MGSLSTSLINSANALRVYSEALEVVQNNVTNANTPGYASQSATLVAQAFDLNTGAPGGVSLGASQSSRSQFAEQSVRTEQNALAYDQQQVSDLSTAQNYFSLSTTSGIAPDLSALFESFSQLSVTPNDTVARQTVLNDAATLAEDFNNTASGLLSQTNNLDQATSSTIASINQLASTIANINSQHRVDPDGGVDAGVDAQLNSSLEQLSQLVNFTTLQQSDGTVSVYIGGQTPLVLGQEAYAVQGDFSTPQAALLSSSGSDITSQITSGQLGAELNDNNNVIPSYVSSLNSLAQTLADQVNNTLNGGIDENGAAPTTNLFSYDATTGAALTLSVNPLTPDQIAAAAPGSPGGNGNALALAALANAPVANGYTFAQAYGNLGAQVGGDLAAAQNNSTTDQSLLGQAQALRQQISGVSLDSQAETLMLYERSYDAISKMLGVLTSLSLDVVNLLPPTSNS